MSRFTNSNNPLIGEKALERRQLPQDYSNGSMSVDGAVNKSLILGCILLFTAVIGYSAPSNLFLFGGMIGGLVLVIVSVIKPQYSAYTAPAYAALEGLFVGTVSAMYAHQFDGIVFQAVSLTMAIFFAMLFLYKSGTIKVTPQFRTGIIMATGAIFIVYILSWILSFFGIQMPFLHENSMIGIGISLAIIGVASLNLLLDFDNFDRGEEFGLPRYYEWFFAMGLIITLVWIYIEVIRLLAILSSND